MEVVRVLLLLLLLLLLARATCARNGAQSLLSRLKVLVRIDPNRRLPSTARAGSDVLHASQCCDVTLVRYALKHTIAADRLALHRAL
eukprot:COSAG01_NODE_9816_length_2333_cov_19.949013_4_plen_87_part_00